ncbi:copper resistance CopC family protein [Umezawaea sp.]|uniref:copper resistance CopC family protein n=1 Tax=Umezawaea sp. TaxID=1955258 RepID=UPI002ECFF821
MNLRRLGAALLLTGLALVGTAAPAFAHAELISSDPAAGASLPTAPTQVVLTFSEPVGLAATPITVTGPDGVTWNVAQVNAAGAVVTAVVEPTGPAGEYVLGYRVVSDDGDEVGADLRFTLAAAATPSTTSAAPTTTTAPTTPPPATSSAPAASTASEEGDGGGVPVSVWIIGAVVLAGAGAFAATRLGRTKKAE